MLLTSVLFIGCSTQEEAVKTNIGDVVVEKATEEQVAPEAPKEIIEETNEDQVVQEVTQNVVEITIDSFGFGYSLDEIKVKEGDLVKLTLTNSDGFHDFVVDELEGAKTKKINTGETDTIEFVASKKGTFEYYCSVGQHRANGMVGNIIVE